MKYIDPKVGTPKESRATEETLFDRTGSEVINEKEKNYAKIVKTSFEGKESANAYYIKTYQNVPFDPSGAYGHREQYLETKFSKVSKDTFDYYMLFLKTKNTLYMTRAQRSFIND